MSERIWSGGAIVTAQVRTATPANVEVGDIFKIVLEDHLGNTNAISYTAVAATVKDVVEGLHALAQAAKTGLAAPWDSVTTSEDDAKLTVTADTAGDPFTLTCTATDGGGTDIQTLTDASVTANSGPNIFSLAENWEGDTAPVSDDSIVIPADATDNIYGEDFSAVLLAGFEIKSNAITIGARKKYLQLDLESPASTYNDVTLGGTGETYLDIDDFGDINVNAAGSAPATGRYGLNLIGTHESTGGVININCDTNQYIGIAANAGEVMEVDDINISGGNVKVGSGVTDCGGAAVDEINVGNGTVKVHCAALAITKEGGELTTEGSGAITTLKNRVGKATLNSTGTITTLEKYDAVVDFSQSLESRTVTTCKVLAGNKSPDDPNGSVTWTNAIEFHDKSAVGAVLNLGADLKFTPAAV